MAAMLHEIPDAALNSIASHVASDSPQQWCKVGMCCKRFWNFHLPYMRMKEPAKDWAGLSWVLNRCTQTPAIDVHMHDGEEAHLDDLMIANMMPLKGVRALRLGEDCHPHSQGLPFVSQWLVSTIDYASQLQALSLDLDSLPEHLGAPLPSSLRLKHLSIAVRVCDHGDISGETFARSARAAAWVRGCLEELKNSDTLESLSVSFPLMDMAASVPWPGSIHLENMSRLKHVAFDTYMPILGGLFLPAGCSLMWGARSSAASDRGSTFRIKHAQPSALQQPRLLTEHNWPYGTWPGPDSAYIITTDIDLGAAQAPVSLQGWSSMGTMAVTTTDSAHFLVPKTWSHNLSLKAESLSVAFEDVDAFVRGMKYFRFQGVTQQLIRFGANIRHACKAAGVKWFQHTETIQGVCRSGRSTKAYTKTWWNVTISSSQDVLHAEWEPISSLGLWPQDPVLEIQDGLIQSLKPNACYHLLHQ